MKAVEDRLWKEHSRERKMSSCLFGLESDPENNQHSTTLDPQAPPLPNNYYSWFFIFIFLWKGKLNFKATWKEQSGVHHHKLVGGRNSHTSIWQCLSGKSQQFLLIAQYLLSFLFRLKLKRLTWRCPLYLCYPNTLISGWRTLGVNLIEGIHLIIKYLYWEYG